MSGADLVLDVAGLGILAYVLTAGADFGGGLWDLLASGPRRAEHKRAIAGAIAPIWEANHVWLIFVVVMLFTGFPKAFAVVATALHIPLLLVLGGIVLRGAAFTFRAYGMEPTERRQRWGRVFAWSSSVTPVFLGMTVAALSSGAIEVRDGAVASGFMAGWLTPLSLLVGLFTLALFALLAAVYLTVETTGAVREDFRRRALALEVIAGALAAACIGVASVEAPHLSHTLLASEIALPLQVLTAGAALSAIGSLVRRRFRTARVAVVFQVALVVLGWGAAMGEYLVYPDITIRNAGLHEGVVDPLLWVLGLGGVLLLPALWLLLRVFKSARTQS